MQRSQKKIDDLLVDVFEPEGPSAAKLLLVHGAWVGGWIWEDFATYLAEAGFACYAPTWRGRYGSAPVGDLGKVSMLDFVKDNLEVFEEVGADVVVGESAGGLVAQKLAEGNPAVKAMVLMNPAPGYMVPASPKLVWRQLKYLPDLLFSRPNLPNAKDYKALILNNVPEPEASEFYERICAESGRALKEMSLGKIKVDPSKIHCPVYLIVGHLDTILPVKVHYKTANLLEAEVIDYPNMSHHTFSESGWEGVADEMLIWLKSKLPATAAP